MSAETEPQDRDPVANAARDAFAQADGDVARATRLMEDAVRASRPLRDELTGPLISGACYSAVREQATGRIAAGRARRSFEGGAPRLTAPASMLPLGQVATGEGLAVGQR